LEHAFGLLAALFLQQSGQIHRAAYSNPQNLKKSKFGAINLVIFKNFVGTGFLQHNSSNECSKLSHQGKNPFLLLLKTQITS
jgi:hypothetical protein